RRIIDVPGYDKIPLHPAARMIGTMNYGYAGTRELNEALVSRFLVIDMPPLTEETLFYLMQSKFPDLKPAARDALAGLYLDLQKKAKQAEITTRALDLRGLFGLALAMTVVCLGQTVAIAKAVAARPRAIWPRPSTPTWVAWTLSRTPSPK
ncbi:MAG TPA: hypothetical protein PLN77_07375, partial [Fusicatenibacter saccharivorans]|nr:hypothetical protein [Fusicatenibacter saccharivorans]